MARQQVPHRKPCARCGHGTGIHHRFAKQKSYPCNHPGCKCKEYVPPKRKG